MFRILFVLVFLTGCSGHVDWRNTSVHSGYSLTRNISYTPPAWPARLSGDLYVPRRQSAAPVVLLVHGGGWEGGDGRWQMEPIAKQLARRGYGVFNVTYRMAPRWIYPAPVEDLQEAIQWLRSHADTYRLDSQRIAVFGYSAGGHLALLTGLLDGPQDSQVRAIVAGGAPSDLRFYPAGRLVPQFLGGTIRQIPERFKDASPVSLVKRCSPPVFIYHGTGDRLVPPEHPLALMAELTRRNVRHETYWVEGRDHIPTFLMPAGSVEAALRFLDREMR